MTVVTLDMYFLISSILLLILCIYLAATRRGARMHRDMVVRELDVVIESKKAADRLVIEHQALAQSAKEDARKLTIKLEAALSANGAFEKSRDQIWDMYRRSGISAGNAQSWLFRELNQALAEVNKYRAEKGEKPKKPPEGLEDALNDFREQHVDTTKEAS